jgi:hypothetical protein
MVKGCKQGYSVLRNMQGSSQAAPPLDQTPPAHQAHLGYHKQSDSDRYCKYLSPLMLEPSNRVQLLEANASK